MKPTLSERERQVLEYAAQGYTDDMIAQALGIGTGTINSYWVRIRGKLGHLSRTHLVANYVQAQANSSRMETRITTDEAAAEQVRASSDLLELERLQHRAEIEASQTAAEKLAKKNKDILDKAEVEIERLRKLLKRK